ncbi:hypothetical protein BCD67_00210 [Oscillatoriales cyanobacterium USR001]|nr:hypothetical protein BCD67_00210 [Oscillatoriales cyanobacterium USR001]
MSFPKYFGYESKGAGYLRSAIAGHQVLVWGFEPPLSNRLERFTLLFSTRFSSNYQLIAGTLDSIPFFPNP